LCLSVPQSSSEESNAGVRTPSDWEFASGDEVAHLDTAERAALDEALPGLRGAGQLTGHDEAQLQAAEVHERRGRQRELEDDVSPWVAQSITQEEG
jgi:hypothetical protein